MGSDERLDIILQELRDLRTDYNDHARETGERLSTLESQMKSLVGNGQPGRIAGIEAAIQKLQEWRWWQLGAAAGVSGAGSMLAWVVVRLWH